MKECTICTIYTRCTRPRPPSSRPSWSRCPTSPSPTGSWRPAGPRRTGRGLKCVGGHVLTSPFCRPAGTWPPPPPPPRTSRPSHTPTQAQPGEARLVRRHNRYLICLNANYCYAISGKILARFLYFTLISRRERVCTMWIIWPFPKLLRWKKIGPIVCCSVR